MASNNIWRWTLEHVQKSSDIAREPCLCEGVRGLYCLLFAIQVVFCNFHCLQTYRSHMKNVVAFRMVRYCSILLFIYIYCSIFLLFKISCQPWYACSTIILNKNKLTIMFWKNRVKAVKKQSPATSNSSVKWEKIPPKSPWLGVLINYKHCWSLKHACFDFYDILYTPPPIPTELQRIDLRKHTYTQSFANPE